MIDFFIATTPVTQSFSQFARRFSRRVAAKLLKTCRIRIDYLDYSHHSMVNLTRLIGREDSYVLFSVRKNGRSRRSQAKINATLSRIFSESWLGHPIKWQ